MKSQTYSGAFERYEKSETDNVYSTETSIFMIERYFVIPTQCTI